MRATIYLDESQNAELEQAKADKFEPTIVEEFFYKAMNEIDIAGSLCKKEDLECLAKYYEKKVNAYSLLSNYYTRRGNARKSSEIDRLRDGFIQKLIAIEEQEKTKQQEDESDLSQTEWGKIGYYLEMGWKEKLFGMSFQSFEEKSKEEQEKIGKQIEEKIKQKISSGKASAEDYIFMSFIEENSQINKAYFDKGTALYEKRNPQGMEAFLLVQLYLEKGIVQDVDIRLNYLNKAKAVVDINLTEAQKLLDAGQFSQLISQMLNAKTDDERLDTTKKLGKLNKQQAEAFYWFYFAFQISSQKAELYERMDLLKKALDEYLYLCNTLKIDEACKNAERLKK